MKLRILTLLVLTGLTIATASAQYKRTDLVSNQPGVAPATDPHLVNGWGLVALPTSTHRVSDHRICLTIHQLDQVIDGSLDAIIEALTTHYQAEKLKEGTNTPVPV